jgi:hypothetical protein
MSSLWLITTYFNPLGWRSRRDNYHTFRRHLDARLLTVSWSPEGNHELEEGDADILIRVDGGDLMWQKERLINIGLAHLPDDCDLVGWVDCDILFQEPSWQQKAIELLRDHEVVQLYGAVEDLEAGSTIDASLESGMQRPSIIQAWQSADNPENFLEEQLGIRAQNPHNKPYIPTNMHGSVGFAWATQRGWLEALGGLPDRRIAGGGDSWIAFALLGHFEAHLTMLNNRGVNRASEACLLRFAQALQASPPRLTCLNGVIRHLHHGDLADRSYMGRHIDLQSTSFLPDEHLELAPSGAWRFNAEAPAAIREVMARYFASRREDGHA